MSSIIQYVLYFVILVALAYPLGIYIKKVMNGEKTVLSKILTPMEKLIYKILHINQKEEMNWKKYAWSVVIFSPYKSILIGICFIFSSINK